METFEGGKISKSEGGAFLILKEFPFFFLVNLPVNSVITLFPVELPQQIGDVAFKGYDFSRLFSMTVGITIN